MHTPLNYLCTSPCLAEHLLSAAQPEPIQIRTHDTAARRKSGCIVSNHHLCIPCQTALSDKTATRTQTSSAGKQCNSWYLHAVTQHTSQRKPQNACDPAASTLLPPLLRRNSSTGAHTTTHLELLQHTVAGTLPLQLNTTHTSLLPLMLLFRMLLQYLLPL